MREGAAMTDIQPSGREDWHRIKEFLRVEMPDLIPLKNVLSVAEGLDAKKIEGLIYERAPFLCLERAMILEKQGGAPAILSVSIVTREMCEGHFPNRLVIPLLFFSKIIALTGELLVAWVRRTEAIVPLAIRAGEVKTASRDLISPPAVVMTEAVFLREKSPYYWVSARSWVGGDNVIAAIKELVYYLMPVDKFLSGANLK